MYKNTLNIPAEANSFYVFSTSFLRKWYYEVQKLYNLYIFCI